MNLYWLCLLTWSAMECPFTIEYHPPVLDEIRPEVTDAFFSVPRGGAEIGGILLGKSESDTVRVMEFAPLDLGA